MSAHLERDLVARDALISRDAALDRARVEADVDHTVANVYVFDRDPAAHETRVRVQHSDHPLHVVTFTFDDDGAMVEYAVGLYRRGDEGWRAAGPRPGVTLTRALPFAELERRARGYLRGAARSVAEDSGVIITALDAQGRPVARFPLVPGAGPGSSEYVAAEARAQAIEADELPARPGRKRSFSDHDLARLARRYVEAVEAEEAKPVRIVAKALNLPASTVRSRLALARERRLLTSVGPGQRGGELTTMALAVLASEMGS